MPVQRFLLELVDDFFRNAELRVPAKQPVTLRIDEDVLVWFKAQIHRGTDLKSVPKSAQTPLEGTDLKSVPGLSALALVCPL